MNGALRWVLPKTDRPEYHLSFEDGSGEEAKRVGTGGFVADQDHETVQTVCGKRYFSIANTTPLGEFVPINRCDQCARVIRAQLGL